MQLKQVFEHYPRSGQAAAEFRFCPSCGEPLQKVESGGRERPACASCGFVQYRNPAPVVSILIVDGERVLLGQRRGEPGKGLWALPSGYVEYEDDYLATAIRETKEETGLEVELVSVFNVLSSFVSPRFHFLAVYVVARVVGGKLVAGDDLAAVEWFPLEGPLPEMGFEEDTRMIEAYTQGLAGLPVDPHYAKPRQILP